MHNVKCFQLENVVLNLGSTNLWYHHWNIVNLSKILPRNNQSVTSITSLQDKLKIFPTILDNEETMIIYLNGYWKNEKALCVGF